ncbi:MAG: 50S ribosomal protein L18 [candidate division WOR-3 bacterium]|nr:50S ribosomal protein L18 [candidate division WOR-3 bacterium]MCX7947952.1 50S ribosomal protein L18 [candidate division WOR-3 bacterium]MDW8150896.1 50S ribosomal protein L18 [candidate division WOR-3 bacterium]
MQGTKIREKIISIERRERRKRRHRAIRERLNIRGTSERPRLVVFRSHKHIYAQIVIDSPVGPCRVITSASSLSPEVRNRVKEENIKTKTNIARLVGILIAKRSIEKGYKTIVFDRGGYKYHGRVKALAEGAREGGLKF